jgi:hypothetical protein
MGHFVTDRGTLISLYTWMFIIKSIKRELKTRPIYDCRCDERLEPKDDETTCLTYTFCLLLIDKARVKDKTYI